MNTLFEPSEKDLMQQAIAEPLDVKITKAIGLLQTFEPSALELNKDGYYLCNSDCKKVVKWKQEMKKKGEGR